MKYTCIVCGAKGIDRSGSGKRKFCSRKCSDFYWREQTNSDATDGNGCLFNEGVSCDVQNCKTCGWHPLVEQRRKENACYV